MPTRFLTLCILSSGLSDVVWRSGGRCNEGVRSPLSTRFSSRNLNFDIRLITSNLSILQSYKNCRHICCRHFDVTCTKCNPDQLTSDSAEPGTEDSPRGSGIWKMRLVWDQIPATGFMFTERWESTARDSRRADSGPRTKSDARDEN